MGTWEAVLLGAIAWWLYARYAKKKKQGALEESRRLWQVFREQRENRIADLVKTTRSHQKHPDDWQLRREFVLKRDGHRCTKCGATSNLQVHHIVPRSRYVDHSASNLVTLCVRCHANENGHGDGLIKTQAAFKAHRLQFDRRKGRKNYTCSGCGREICKGEISYAKRTELRYGRWAASNKRLCENCILNESRN
jgi:5-methylcytosine-specific restriction endonuclease McrA